MEELDPLNLDRDRQGRELASRGAPDVVITVKDGTIRGKPKQLKMSTETWRAAKKKGWLNYKSKRLFVDGDTLVTEMGVPVSKTGNVGYPNATGQYHISPKKAE